MPFANRFYVRRTLAALSLLAMVNVPPESNAAERTKPRLEHIGILVRNTSQTAEFLTQIMGFRLNDVKWQVGSDTPQSGGMKLGFVDGNGMQFTLIEPTSSGPVLNDLNNKGDGAFYEMDFEVPDFDTAVDELEASGVPIVNMDGKPFPPGKRGWLVEPYGLRLIYIPRTVSQGMTIEVYQRGPASTDILDKRDEGFKQMPAVAPGALQLSHIVILVDSIDRAAAFLTKTLKLHVVQDTNRPETRTRMGAPVKCRLLQDDAGTRVEIVQPLASKGGAALLSDKGTGYVTEIVYKAADFRRFTEQMHAKNISMIMKGRLHDPQRITGCIAAAGKDHVASFPLDVSHGLRFTVMSAN